MNPNKTENPCNEKIYCGDPTTLFMSLNDLTLKSNDTRRRLLNLTSGCKQ